MDKAELLSEVNKTITTNLEKSLPEIVDASISLKLSAIETKTVGEIEDIKKELKKLSVSSKKVDTAAQGMIAKTAIVEGWKALAKGGKFEEAVTASIKTMSEGTGTEGAELVFDQFERDVIRVINAYDVVSLVRSFNILKGDKVIFPSKDGSTTAAYVGEGSTISESELTTGNVAIDIYKVATLTGVTNELLDDTMTVPDLYNLIVEDVAEQVAALQEDAILGGTGTNQPTGITNASGIIEVALGTAETTADIADTNLVDVMTRAAKRYKRNTSWVMSQYTWGKLMSLKTTDGYPLYPELRNMTSPSLLGRPVVISDSSKIVQDAGTDVADAVSIIFGDFDFYYMANRKGLSFEKGHLANDFRDDKTTFRSITRFGGNVAIPAAFTVLKNGVAA